MAVNLTSRDSELLAYLGERKFEPGERLPAIPSLALELGLSTGKLREQLEVARMLGLVDVRPKLGIRAAAYSFSPAVWLSLRHGLALDTGCFEHFEVLRNHLEAAFFHEAVELLRAEDIEHMQALVASAWRRLRGEPIQIPHAEHREFHLTTYSRLDNPFVRGLLEAYWEAYETVGLSVYADYRFLHDVWTYHERMAREMQAGNVDAAHALLVEHTGLVQMRPRLAREPGRSGVSPAIAAELRSDRRGSK
jgi:DNA-binding FadR family transcriptional regulator